MIGELQTICRFRYVAAKVALTASFAPNGSWFVFDLSTGRTTRRNFSTAQLAFAWIHQQRIRARPKSQTPQGVIADGHY
jgi:hypothetical protein